MRAVGASRKSSMAAGAAAKAVEETNMSMEETSGERERAEPAGRSLSTRPAQTLPGRPLPLNDLSEKKGPAPRARPLIPPGEAARSYPQLQPPPTDIIQNVGFEAGRSCSSRYSRYGV